MLSVLRSVLVTNPLSVRLQVEHASDFLDAHLSRVGDALREEAAALAAGGVRGESL